MHVVEKLKSVLEVVSHPFFVSLHYAFQTPHICLNQESSVGWLCTQILLHRESSVGWLCRHSDSNVLALTNVPDVSTEDCREQLNQQTQKHDYQNVCRANQHLIPCSKKYLASEMHNAN